MDLNGNHNKIWGHVAGWEGHQGGIVQEDQHHVKISQLPHWEGPLYVV